MSWYRKAKRDLSELLSMSGDDLLRLTWEQASEFVLPDTVEMARWRALRASGRPAYECLFSLKRLQLPSSLRRVA